MNKHGGRNNSELVHRQVVQNKTNFKLNLFQTKATVISREKKNIFGHFESNKKRNQIILIVLIQCLNIDFLLQLQLLHWVKYEKKRKGNIN